MKTEVYFSDVGITVRIIPETAKEASKLAYLNRNFVPDARRAADYLEANK